MEQNVINEAVVELVTIRDLLRFCASHFASASLYYGHGTTNAWDEAFALVFGALNIPFDQPASILDSRLTTSERLRILNLANVRIKEQIPVPYLTQQAWFANQLFYVDERVLIPRSPIAEVIQAHFEPWIDPDTVHNILDLCTGSACIAIACAYEFPYAEIDAVDISKEALIVAEINRTKHHLQKQVQLLQGDLFKPIAKGKNYDIIIANPPYVDTEDMASLPKEFQHEPTLALAAGDDGLTIIKRILAEANQYLAEQGILIVEVGNSAAALIEQFPEVNFTWLEFTDGDAEVFLLTKAQLTDLKI